MTNSDWAIPTGYMNDIREVERFKTIKAMLPILGGPEQKALWLKELEALAASISDRIERNRQWNY